MNRKQPCKYDKRLWKGKESLKLKRTEWERTLTRPSPVVMANKSREGLKAVKMPLMSVEEAITQTVEVEGEGEGSSNDYTMTRE